MLKILKRKKENLSPLQKVLVAFHEWKIDTLNIDSDTLIFNNLNRVYIKDEKWFFNDYFDIKFDKDVAKNSQRYIRDATNIEVSIFDSFINLIDILKKEKT